MRLARPNESYKPGLAIAAVLLLLYVVLVGPVNFRFIGKRGTPTLALLTTPALAALGLVAMLGVGYIGKGVLMRYRRVEVSEAIEGERFAPSRRYTSLFLTRPVVFDLDAPARGALTMVPGGMGDVPPTTEHPGGAPTCAMCGRSGRRSSHAKIGSRISGSVTSSATDGVRLRAQRHGAGLRGGHHRRARRSVHVGKECRGGGDPDDGPRHASAPGGYYGGTTIDPAGSSLARDLGLAVGEEDDVLQGVIALAGGTLASPPCPRCARRRAARSRRRWALRARTTSDSRIVPRLPGARSAWQPPPTSRRAATRPAVAAVDEEDMDPGAEVSDGASIRRSPSIHS